MGLRPLDRARWLLVDDRYPEEMSLRHALLARVPGTVVATLPGTRPAGSEVLDEVVDHLTTFRPDAFRRTGAVLHTPAGDVELDGPEHPLVRAARCVQEDLLLLEERAGTPTMVAGVVCFPSRWDLAAKLGRPLREIHGPVPRFDAQLGPAADAALMRLTPDRPQWRVGWTLDDVGELHQPPGSPGRPAPAAVADVADTVRLRLELETLRRLPRHGAVLFTIRTVMTPLRWFASDPAEAGRLARALRAIPDDVAAYKSLGASRDAAARWLEEVAMPAAPSRQSS
jgi:dimethylamine monooxygenase subunit A